MLNHESVAEPLGIGLNMLVDPFLCLWSQWAEQEHSSYVTHQYVRRAFSFEFHVIALQVLPPAASALVGDHRGTLFCPRLAEMPRGHPALDARSESHIARGLSMALPYGYPKIPSASLLPQPIDDVTSFEAYGGPNAEAGDASRLSQLEHRLRT
jgi:hypothetical protein